MSCDHETAKRVDSGVSPVPRGRLALMLSLTLCLGVFAGVAGSSGAAQRLLGPGLAYAQELKQADPKERGPVRMVNKNLPDIAVVFEEQKDKVVAVQTEMARQATNNPFQSSPSGPRVGQGSGFVVDAQGYIVTNYHVVAGASKIQVNLATGKNYPAKLVGADEKTDIALLKINPSSPLTAVVFGSSEELRVGEWVVAIGSPFGLAHSVTAGILSAKGRNLGQGPYDDFLQTDASINPGNSGGPLFNLHGEVVGVNTAIIRDGQGIGFAVPVDIVKTILPQLRERGYVVRGYIGAGIQELSEELAKSFSLKPNEGVLIGSLSANGPASGAKLQVGDVITNFGPRRVKTTQELLFAVAETPPGTSVTVEFIRQGQRQTTQLKVTERPDTKRPAAVANGRANAEPPSVGQGQPASQTRLGVEVIAVEPELVAQLNLKSPTGAYVRDVLPGTPAAGSLRAGDVIMQVNQYKVTRPADLEKILGTIDQGGAVRMLVWRGGRSVFVALRLS